MASTSCDIVVPSSRRRAVAMRPFVVVRRRGGRRERHQRSWRRSRSAAAAAAAAAGQNRSRRPYTLAEKILAVEELEAAWEEYKRDKKYRLGRAEEYSELPSSELE